MHVPTRSNIWNFAQNKPTLIVKDLEPYASEGFIYDVLLKRGVFKWFAVRRDLIKLKESWKARLNHYDEMWRESKGLPRHSYHTAYLKGYRAALRECREEVRELCHSERWRAPDNDKAAQQWLDMNE